MKKSIIVFLVLAVVIFIGYRAYKFYVPRAIANALTSKDEMKIAPPKVKRKVKELKVEVDENVDFVPEIMVEVGLEYEDLETIVDKAEEEQFFNALEEVKLHEWETTDDVFDIGLKHVSIEGYDLEKFRSVFNDYATVEKIEQLLEVLEENEFLASMSIPVAKETGKRILESRKEEILQKLNELESQ